MTRYGQDFASVHRSKTTFEDPLRWARGKKLNPGDRIFTCSISDFFIEEADEWRPEAWDIIRRTPFTYLILTKRIERVRQFLPSDWGSGYKNVWLGTSVESQEYAWRLIYLLDTPAALHWVSAEPLLDSLSLRDVLPRDHHPFARISLNALTGVVVGGGHAPNRVRWVVVGGESGSSPRPMNPRWADWLRRECEISATPFFFKQMGGNKLINGHWGGNELDGKAWEEFPSVKDT